MATRKLVRKEAGTIAYTLREIKDFSGEANADNPAVAVSVVGGRTVTADELAREIAASCTVKEADVAGGGMFREVMLFFVNTNYHELPTNHS